MGGGDVTGSNNPSSTCIRFSRTEQTENGPSWLIVFLLFLHEEKQSVKVVPWIKEMHNGDGQQVMYTRDGLGRNITER